VLSASCKTQLTGISSDCNCVLLPMDLIMHE
jgi:hypothetical protein